MMRMVVSGREGVYFTVFLPFHPGITAAIPSLFLVRDPIVQVSQLAAIDTILSRISPAPFSPSRSRRRLLPLHQAA